MDLAIDNGIEHANATPEMLAFGNELVMPRRILVTILAGQIAKHDVQPDVKIAIVDIALQVFGKAAAREKDFA